MGITLGALAQALLVPDLRGSAFCDRMTEISRRTALLGVVATASSAPLSARAFDNAVRKVKGPKSPGLQPKDLGLNVRSYDEANDVEVVGLKGCGRTLNCFSTTFEPALDRGIRAIDPWRFTGKTPSAAMREVLKAVYAYPPGQEGIDAGGFEVKASETRYVYVQFKDVMHGHIDDVEFAVAPGTDATATEGKILVRSSMRQSYSDYGVNAVRLNRLAADLRGMGGWTAPAIDGKTHPGYWTRGHCRAEDVRERYPGYCPGWPQ